MKIKSIFLSILLISGSFVPTLLSMHRFTSRQIATPVLIAEEYAKFDQKRAEQAVEKKLN